VEFNGFSWIPDQLINSLSPGEDIIPDTSGAPVVITIVDLESGEYFITLNELGMYVIDHQYGYISG
jgi:hypothetical protein